MKNANGMWTKMLSVLLVLVMVLGFVPVASAAQKDPIVLDFMAFADIAPQQSWWSDLRDTNVEGIKALGMKYGVSPTAEYTAALKELGKWLDENVNWDIPDLYDGSNGHYNHPYAGRRIFIDGINDHYGLRFYTSYPNNGYGESKCTLTFDVPSGSEAVFFLRFFRLAFVLDALAAPLVDARRANFVRRSQLRQRAPHRRFNGSKGQPGRLRDLLVRQRAVLTQQKDVLFFPFEPTNRVAQRGATLPFDRSFLRFAVARRRFEFLDGDRLPTPPPTALEQVESDVIRDAKDPSAQVRDLVERVPLLPTANESVLQRVASVVRIPQQMLERPQQLRLEASENVLQLPLRGRSRRRAVVRKDEASFLGCRRHLLINVKNVRSNRSPPSFASLRPALPPLTKTNDATRKISASEKKDKKVFDRRRNARTARAFRSFHRRNRFNR